MQHHTDKQYDLNSTVFTATVHLLNFRVKMFVPINMLVITCWISLLSILLLEIICPKYLKLLTYRSFSPLAWNSGKQDITTLYRSHGETRKPSYRQVSARQPCLYEDFVFCHLNVVWRPVAEEQLAISTQSIHLWKVHLVGYNSVADNTGLSSFV